MSEPHSLHQGQARIQGASPPSATRFRIVQPGGPSSGDGRVDLVISRGAFGSGEHETTASCLEMLPELPGIERASVLDLGSGTAILAIAALALGAANAVCVDTDPEAVATARTNCALNEVTDRVTHVTGTLADFGQRGFDLVLANIYSDILLDVAEDLVERARPGAAMLLSGVLWEDNFAVRQRYRRLGCTLVRNLMLEEYSTLAMRR